MDRQNKAKDMPRIAMREVVFIIMKIKKTKLVKKGVSYPMGESIVPFFEFRKYF